MPVLPNSSIESEAEPVPAPEAKEADGGGAPVELLLPSTAIFNEPVSIAVLREGAPVSGRLSITSPSGRVFFKQLSNGRATFVFDEEGEWSVGFGNLSKGISVSKGGGAVQGTRFLSDALSHQALQLPDYAWLLALALLLPLPFLALLIYMVAFRPRIEFSKACDGGSVTLRVENPGIELWNATLLDIVQEGELLDAGEAKVSDTIFGKVLKWERGIIRSGEGWEVSYRVSGVKNHARAELNARAANGEVRVKSRMVLKAEAGPATS